MRAAIVVRSFGKQGLARRSVAALAGLGSLAAWFLSAAQPTLAAQEKTPPARTTIVVCAPGYPGNTVQAQPTMDLFAKGVAKAAGWPSGGVAAVYEETEKGGLERMRASNAALALVPLPFFLQHAAELQLGARLSVEQESGSTEVWSLAARKGQITSAASLAGWEITGVPGYAPAFVRGPVLARWGAVPSSTRITFSAGVLAALRRAAAGEKVAVVLDRAQTASLATLPMAKDLEVVAASGPLPASLVCAIGRRLEKAQAAKLLDALLRFHTSDEGSAVLTTMRMKRFVPVDPAAVEQARRSFDTAR